MNTDDVATRVAKGVALLDERKPGWAGQIDLIKLDVEDPDRCILGQLYPVSEESFWPDGFNQGIDALEIDSGFEYGVDCLPSERFDEQQFDYVQLTREWKRVIEILRQKQASEVEVPETVAA
jgi:hypothetical protein